MARAELTAITIENFKSYQDATTLDVAPLTVLLGRNNSGKSSLIQVLLLLKQTLEHPRDDVPLHLEGPVDALGLRELTHGWPEGQSFLGPCFRLEWDSTVEIKRALAEAGSPGRGNLVKHSGIEWLAEEPATVRLRTTMTLQYHESGGRIWINEITLWSELIDSLRGRHYHNPAVYIAKENASQARYSVEWRGKDATQFELEFDHFLPFFRIDRRNFGPRHRIRSWFNGYLVLYEQPLEDLRALLQRFTYLGSMRMLPPSIYRPASVPPAEIGVSGELAAQMLHARRADVVHYLAPLQIASDGSVTVPDVVEARPLVSAVNHVMSELGISAPLRIEDIQNLGFRLFFGQASLQHVGRGLGYLLPVVQLGLISDPRRFDAEFGASPRDEYLKALDAFTHVAIEEPETHLHPKVQTRLAHWFVTLAMSGRRLIVETHSDHLVRRLRGLIARAEAGGALEEWLAKNVVIAEVTQDEEGYSALRCSRLTPDGRIDEWPADFMDEASDEERSIYYAALDKEPPAEMPAGEIEFIHDPDEPE
jgi:predicted ATPase